MSSSSFLPYVALVIALAVAWALGLWWRSRQGQVRAVPTTSLAEAEKAGPDMDPALAGLGVGQGAAVVLHFSASWCGPCTAARTVIQSAVAQGAAREVEVDLDENQPLARTLGVLSLPTTFVYDPAGVVLARISGVPKLGPLRELLEAYSH